MKLPLNKPPKWYFLSTIMGFLGCIVWIYVIATGRVDRNHKSRDNIDIGRAISTTYWPKSLSAFLHAWGTFGTSITSWWDCHCCHGQTRSVILWRITLWPRLAELELRWDRLSSLHDHAHNFFQIAACFGAPLLNLLVGVGFGCTVTIATSSSKEFIPLDVRLKIQD